MSTSGPADLQRWRAAPVMRLLSTGSLLEGNHLNKVWRGMAQIPGSTESAIPVIVKWVDKAEVIAAELACALAARALKLQVPSGTIILAEKQDLPGLPARVKGANTAYVVCYGSELQWPDDAFARPISADSAEEYIWEKLCDSAQGPSGGVWDELIANNDRHHENVVFDGHRWWLIDHERTLPSVAKTMRRFAEDIARQSVIADFANKNVLAHEVLRRRPQTHKMDALPSNWSAMRQRLRWMADQAQTWRTGHDSIDTVLMMTHVYLRGIDLRLPALALHLERRLQRPEPTSLWNSSSSTPPPTKRSRRPR